MLINSIQVCMVHCHICRQQKNVAKLNMFRNGTWAPIFCRTCRLNRKSSKWKCPCGVCWHQCKLHRKHGFNCRASEKPVNPKGKNDNCMGLKSSKLQRFIRKRGPRKDCREESLKKSSITGASDQKLRIRLRKKTKPERMHPDVTQNQQQKKRKLTTAQSQHRPPEKRGLPVAWGSDIFKKCPRLLDQFSKFSLPRPPEPRQ